MKSRLSFSLPGLTTLIRPRKWRSVGEALLLAVALSFTFSATSGEAQAQSPRYWFSERSGNWTEVNAATNPWGQSGYPGAASRDAAVIDDGHVVTLAGTSGLNPIVDLDVREGGTLNVNSFSLQITEDFSNSGIINFNSSALAFDRQTMSMATNVATGVINFTGNSSINTAYIYNFGKINFLDGVTTVSDSALLAGPDYLSGSGAVGSLTLDNATVNLAGNSVLDLFSDEPDYSVLKMKDSTLNIGADSYLSFCIGSKLVISGENTIQGAGTFEFAVNDGPDEFFGEFLVEGNDAATDKLNLKTEIATYVGFPGYDWWNPSIVLKDVTFQVDGYDYNAGDYNKMPWVSATGNSRVIGTGGTGMTFLFYDDSSLRPGGDGAVGTFKAQSLAFIDNSKIYIDIASNAYDKIQSVSSLDLAEPGANVEIILINLGNHDTVVDASDMISASRIYINDGYDLSDADFLQDEANNTATFSQDAATVTIKSAQQGGQDTIKINEVVTGQTDDNGYVATTSLGVKVTGVKVGDDPGPIPSGPTAGEQNIQTIGAVVLNEMQGTDLYNAIAAYAGADQEKLEEALASLDPIQASLAATSAQNGIVQFTNLVGNRVGTLAGTTGFSAPGTYRGQECDPCAPCGGRSGGRELWFDFLGNYVDQKTKDDILGYYGSTYGFGAGVDKKINRNLVLGVSFGGAFSSIHGRQHSSKGEYDNYMVSLYGCVMNGPWALSFNAGYNYTDVETKRYSMLGYAEGDSHANTGFGSVELSRRFGSKKHYLTPFLGFDYVGYRQSAYEESGVNINMTVDKQKTDGYLQTLGVRFGRQMRNNFGWLVTPEFTLGWIHDYGKGNVVTTGNFVQGGSPFTVVGTSRNKDRALVGVSLGSDITSRTSLFVRYDGELCEKFNSQTFQAGARVKF